MKPTFRFSADQRRDIEKALSSEAFDRLLMDDFIRALELDTDMLQFRLFADPIVPRRRRSANPSKAKAEPAQGPGRPPRDHERDFAGRVAWLFSDHLGVAPRTAHRVDSSSFAAVIGVCLRAIGLHVPKDPFDLLADAVRDVAPKPISEICLTKAERRAIKGSTKKKRKKVGAKGNRRPAN